MAEFDEVLLEADLLAPFDLQPGAQPVVGHRQEAETEAEALGQLRGDGAECHSFGQPLGAVEVGGQVLVAQVEPGDAS